MANTAVFTDSQFTASSYGQNLARQCLNPSTFTDSQKVDFISAPAGRPDQLVVSRKNSQPVYTFRATTDRVTGHQSTGSYYHKPYFDQSLNDASVKRVMVFMGLNDISFSNGTYSPAGWEEIAKSIKEKGKECIVGLPPMFSNSGRGELIQKYNKKVAEILKDTDCKIVDTSNSLSEQGPYKKFHAGDGLHFTSSSASQAAQATCEALQSTLRNIDNPQQEEIRPENQNTQEPTGSQALQETELGDFFTSEF